MLAIQSSNESVSMLVTNMSASFGKKATERSTFLCVDGLQVFEAIDHTIKTGEGVTVDMQTIGTMPNGEQVSDSHSSGPSRSDQKSLNIGNLVAKDSFKVGDLKGIELLASLCTQINCV